MLVLLLSALLSAGSGPTPAPPINTVNKTMPSPDGGSIYWFVDKLGNDGNSCTAPFTDGGSNGPCLTPTAALNKIPKMIRHSSVLTLDAGTYPGFVVSGFMADQSLSTSVGLLVQGVLAPSVLQTGFASGTATGGSGGSQQVFGTLIDTNNSLTTNDATGRLLCTSNSNPANSCFPIESNNSSIITIVGGAGVGGWVAPVNGTTYTIQDAATIINTPVTAPGTPFNVPQTNRAGIIFLDNYALGGRTGFITLKNIMVAPTTGNFGIVFTGAGSYVLNQVQVHPVVNGAAISSGGAAGSNPAPGLPQLMVQNSDIYLASPATGSVLNWGSPMPLTVIGTFVRGNSTTPTQFGLIAPSGAALSEWEIAGTTNGVWILGSGIGTSINSGRINCSTFLNSTAISVGNSSTVSGVPGVAAQTGGGTIDHVNLSGCDTGLLVDGIASAELHGFTGSVGRQLIQVMNGGYVGVNQVNLTPASITVGDGGTGLVGVFANADNVAFMDAGTDLSAFQNRNLCFGFLPQGSRACGR